MMIMSSSFIMTMIQLIFVAFFRVIDYCSAMSEDWVGQRVSLDCGGLGFFQRFICRINLGEQTVILEKPFQNGLACKFPEITLNASDIKVRRFKFTRNHS